MVSGLLKFLNFNKPETFPGYMSSLKNVLLDRFSRFYVYWKQTNKQNKFQIISLTILGIDILGGRLGGDNRHPSVQVQFTSNPTVNFQSCTIVPTISYMYTVHLQLQFTYYLLQSLILYRTCLVYRYSLLAILYNCDHCIVHVHLVY